MVNLTSAMGEPLSDQKFEIKETDMEEHISEVTIDIVKQSQKLYSVDKVCRLQHPGSLQDVAAYIKEEMDKRFGPTWHVVVGRSFGSRVSYEMSHFLLLKVNKTSIMIFKCGY